MKILLDSYNNSFQHIGGGVPMKVQMYHQYFQTPDITTKLFDKWNDKLADYDILHIVKLTVDNCAQIKFAKDLGKKVVISAVIPQIEPLKIKIALLLKKYLKISSLYSLIYQSLKLADSIIVETSIEANFIINNYNISKSKIVVIPNGVNQQILDNFENDMSVSKDIVLCVGRFDSNKNQLNLIRALRGTDYQLHFIGGSSPYDNSYYTKCKDAAKEYGNIHFHGWMSNESKEYFDLYKCARVVCLVSHNEIFGNALIEGGASGANLVATSVLPVQEWGFNEHCVSVDVSNPENIKNAVQKAYSMPIDKSLFSIIKKQFAWEVIVDKHVNVYKSLM